MTPDRPGRWRVRFTDGREATYHVQAGDPDGHLAITWEEGYRETEVYPPSTVRQFTELLESMAWGAWVDRVGDLPAGQGRG